MAVQYVFHHDCLETFIKRIVVTFSHALPRLTWTTFPIIHLPGLITHTPALCLHTHKSHFHTPFL